MPSAAAPHPARPATPYDVGRPQPGPYAPGRDPADSSGSFMATRPTSVQPVSGGLGPDPYPGFEPSNFPSSGFPSSGFPYAEPSSGAGDPFGYGRSRVFGSPPPKKRRTGLLIALVAVIGLLVGAGAGAGITAAVVGGRSPAPSPTGSRAAPPTREQLLLPAAAPVAPGVEPPRGGGWPSSWPTFTSTEPTRPMTGLAGVGFDFRVPPTWTCTEQQQAGAAVRYACGAGAGADRTGGDLVVRDCTAPCDEAGRTALRQKEEAWGLHWTRSGPFVTWAETTRADGKQQYGLVYVAFWRSAPEHQLDRELVLRLTSPLGRSDDLKKVVNSVRDSTFTL